VRPKDDASAINKHDFTDRFPGSDGSDARVIEIQQLAGQRQLNQIFCGDRFRLVYHREDLEAGIHAMDDFVSMGRRPQTYSQTLGASSSSISARTDSPEAL